MDVSRPPRQGFWAPGWLTPVQVDWAVVGAALLLSLPAAVHGAYKGGATGALLVVTLPAGTLPLRWRRSHPAAALAVLMASFAAWASVAPNELGGAGLVFGTYAAALYGSRHVRLGSGILALAFFGASFGVIVASQSSRPFEHVVPLALFVGIAWVFGDRTRTRRAYLLGLEERARRLEIERDDHARRAAEDERSRIARELHDVVAHSVSVIAVQAGAGRRTARRFPERSAEVFETIEHTARGALGELRVLLGVLRRDGDELSLRRPQPTLAELDALVDEARHAGVGVAHRVEGSARPLDGVLDVCAYRVVQEALTNVMKHAPGAHAHVLVRYGEEDLVVTVVDDGPGPEGARGGGHGLVGMRERVKLVSGKLEAGRAGSRGFRVHAVLPYGVIAPPGLAGALSRQEVSGS